MQLFSYFFPLPSPFLLCFLLSLSPFLHAIAHLCCVLLSFLSRFVLLVRCTCGCKAFLFPSPSLSNTRGEERSSCALQFHLHPTQYKQGSTLFQLCCAFSSPFVFCLDFVFLSVSVSDSDSFCSCLRSADALSWECVRCVSLVPNAVTDPCLLLLLVNFGFKLWQKPEIHSSSSLPHLHST